MIHSNCGSIMTVPREGRFVRLYVQLAETDRRHGDFDRNSVTPQTILDRARPILAPYTLDFNVCDWQSVYTVVTTISHHYDHVLTCPDRTTSSAPFQLQRPVRRFLDIHWS